jgi:hypothetical protein
MAELSIGATQVLSGADAEFFQGIAGQAVTAGQVCYLDSLSHRLRLADANGSQDSAEVVGIALHQADAEQPLRIQTAGTLTLGATAAPAVSTVYIVGGNPGGIAPVADKVIGWHCSILGVGAANNTLKLALFPSRTVQAS